MFLSLRNSAIVIFILNTAFSVTEAHPRRDSAKYKLLGLLILIHQNTKSTTAFNIYNILQGRPARPFQKCSLLKLLRRPQDVIFGNIL